MKIVICCSSGITSRILMKKLKMYVEEFQSSYQFEAVNEHFLETELEGCDLLILAPHIELVNRKELEEKHSLLVCQMDSDMYAEMNPEQIIRFIGQVLSEKNDSSGTKRNRIVEVVMRFSHLTYIQLMMETLMSITPFMLFGSVLSLISLLPLGEVYQQFLAYIHLETLLHMPLELLVSYMSLFLLVSFCCHFSRKKGGNPAYLIIAVLTVYLLHMPGDYDRAFLSTCFGTANMAFAFIIGIITCEVYLFYEKKMKKKGGKEIAVYMLILVTFLVLRGIFMYFSIPNLYEVGEKLMQKPLSYLSTDIYSFLLFLLISNIFWMLGVHGTSITIMSILPLYTMITNTNLAAYAQGLATEYPIWIFTHWCFIGGAGNLLALNLLMLKSRKEKNRMIAKYSLTTSVFAIGEPMFFGVPIAYNLYFALPFVLSPIVNALVCYVVIMKLAWVPVPLGIYLDNFYPFGLETIILTKGVGGWILYVALLGLDMAIYYPFFKLYDSEQIE